MTFAGYMYYPSCCSFLPKQLSIFLFEKHIPAGSARLTYTLDKTKSTKPTYQKHDISNLIAPHIIFHGALLHSENAPRI